MATIRREKFRTLVPAMDRLVRDYFDRTNAQDGIPQLEMDWGFYTRLNELNRMAVMAAREDDDLIGFGMYVLGPHPHHKAHQFAICDILAVSPEWRGKGLGQLIVEHALQKFKHMGIDYVLHNFRHIYDVVPLFEKMGFAKAETTYLMRL